MAAPIDTVSRVMPSATPSEADIAAWQTLPRDEQLRRLQERLKQPSCADVSTTTMNDILSRAQAAAKQRHG